MTAQDIARRITLLGLQTHHGPLPRMTQRVLFGRVLFGRWPVELDCAASTVTVTWDNDAGFSAIRTVMTFERVARQARMT